MVFRANLHHIKLDLFYHYSCMSLFTWYQKGNEEENFLSLLTSSRCCPSSLIPFLSFFLKYTNFLLTAPHWISKMSSFCFSLPSSQTISTRTLFSISWAPFLSGYTFLWKIPSSLIDGFICHHLSNLNFQLRF